MSDFKNDAAAIYLGILLDEAKTYKFDGRPISDMQRLLGDLSGDHFPEGPARQLFEAAESLVMAGTFPIFGAIRASRPELEGYARHVTTLARSESDFETGDFVVAIEAVKRDALKRDVKARIEEAAKLFSAGDIAQADERLRRESTVTPGRLLPLRQDTYASNSLDGGRARFIAAPWKALTDSLGGGYGVGGTYAVTAVIGPTGHGKSTWARQQVPYFLEQGHRVLYFAGESLHDEVLQDIYSLTAGITKDMLRMRTPIALEKYEDAYRYIQQFRKGLNVVAGARLTVQKINDLARAAQLDLEADRLAGLAGEDSSLMVIVDNLDHAVHKSARQSEWEAYDEAAHEFAEAASHGGWALMLLSQPSSEGTNRLGPAYEYEIQGGRRVANSTATILSLWRPIHAEHREAKDKNGEPHPCSRPWVAKRKCRANGQPDQLAFQTNYTGLWYPEGSRPITRNFKTGDVINPDVPAF
ncbi:hypothetical protein D3875_00035 [Deinococcus cavernae]|uniref:SF4 helicase domain-containing protein n=1 Tax=Deinococcus cavernae TaxID=2320857 RepID=A0A418VJ61_9DEIO|nr:hypothetical protein [Deinococcus cavernae]RJF76143.1 hypothetical protein D3875_00035 [Deinococcus cavernae]